MSDILSGWLVILGALALAALLTLIWWPEPTGDEDLRRHVNRKERR